MMLHPPNGLTDLEGLEFKVKDRRAAKGGRTRGGREVRSYSLAARLCENSAKTERRKTPLVKDFSRCLRLKHRATLIHKAAVVGRG